MQAIPRDIAVQLCNETRIEQLTKWYTWFFSPCWSCTTFAGGIPERMGIAAVPGYRGCPNVNARYQARCIIADEPDCEYDRIPVGDEQC